MQIWLIKETTRDEGVREFCYEGSAKSLIEGLKEHCLNCVGGEDKDKIYDCIVRNGFIFASAVGEDYDKSPWEMTLEARDITALPEFYFYKDND